MRVLPLPALSQLILLRPKRGEEWMSAEDGSVHFLLGECRGSAAADQVLTGSRIVV